MRVLRIGTKCGDVSIKSIPNTLEALQEIVGGYIEIAPEPELANIDLVLVCNEEGVLMNLDLNENLFPFFYTGTCFIAATDCEDFCDMSNEQIAWAKDWLRDLWDHR